MGTALSRLTILARVVPASALALAPNNEPGWNLTNLAGRLVELSANAAAAHVTAAFGLVLDAQLGGDSAAWITLEHSSFFPPDVVDGGVDLDALLVVRVTTVGMAGRAADHLVRSGGFGLVVVDLSCKNEMMTPKARAADKLPVPLLSRLIGLAQQQNVTALLLTKKSSGSPSLHSLISLRAEARWQRREGRCELSVRVLKDKRYGRKWVHSETCRGPAGLY
jgi:recombination protein RecA